MKKLNHIAVFLIVVLLFSCGKQQEKSTMENDSEPVKSRNLTAEKILGNPDYQAISYGGYRQKTRDSQPTIKQLKQDLKILHELDIKVLRTYNVRLAHASNVLKAIKELKNEDSNFEMYVMLGAWIDCKNAWTDMPVNHNEEADYNEDEIKRAMDLANKYPDIVKVIAVGNEAMVKWATSYFVQPNVILKWVNYLQDQKAQGNLSKDLWITSSDNFASWGGGSAEYHVPDLEALVKAVDFLSVHTYPMHDTHYNPVFWGVLPKEASLPNSEKLDNVMKRSLNYAVSQFDSVVSYMNSIGVKKPVHIGETGWASVSNGHYGPKGSKACDEYKQALFYNKMRKWSNENNVSCFYFEAFDEPWKDYHNDKGSENHFGLFTVDGKAKYVLWDKVDEGTFENLKRDNHEITKTYNGSLEDLLIDVDMPHEKQDITVNH
jgi:exo-beta-1,3-glucanase (GH17 family)